MVDQETYDLTPTGAAVGPINPAFPYSLELSDFAPWFHLAVFVGPKEYDLGRLSNAADLTFYSASPLNLGMIGYLDGRDSINYLWSNTEIDVRVLDAPGLHLGATSVPEPSPAGLLLAGLFFLVVVILGRKK